MTLWIQDGVGRKTQKGCILAMNLVDLISFGCLQIKIFSCVFIDVLNYLVRTLSPSANCFA